ncbi:HlyD family secretion protein [Pseudoxanthomonas sp. GM95]|uniref:efflux RND transporter periplasmic adaptor subunit n=1 Tax=Pseudoxanthomonas sp. GM95 TaxID=1881043 RepID=UPI0008C85B35|nr:HlyD family efflux transporter periplasmic adaptor subunit [Pseudoxanthomonas sp. GM95]SEM16112.1 HlyD family secretion protein [Pseudoxanthomonas sp. GM95]
MNPRTPVLILAVLAFAGCKDAHAPASTETVQPHALMLSVSGSGQLRAAKATALTVPGSDWDNRQLDWMLPEGSRVKKGELIARFSSPEGRQALDKAAVDLERNALQRLAKEDELASARGRVDVDLSDVATQLGIAQRYAHADLSTLARNEVLDAVQDAQYLGERQGTLRWQRDQSGQRGAAELGVLDAQRATFDMTAKARQRDMDALELRAPTDGVVLLESNWSGTKPMIGSSLYAGAPYGSLPDMAELEVEITLPQQQAQGVRAGNAVELFPVGHPELRFTTKLSWIASAAKSLSRQNPVKYLAMRAPVPDAKVKQLDLVPGQQLQARVILLQADRAIDVPNIALNEDKGSSYVEVRDGGQFARRTIKLGVRGPSRTQVLDGLKPGDEILLADAGIAPTTGTSKAGGAP